MCVTYTVMKESEKPHPSLASTASTKMNGLSMKVENIDGTSIDEGGRAKPVPGDDVSAISSEGGSAISIPGGEASGNAESIGGSTRKNYF